MTFWLLLEPDLLRDNSNIEQTSFIAVHKAAFLGLQRRRMPAFALHFQPTGAPGQIMSWQN